MDSIPETGSSKKHGRGHETILLVDDEPHMLHLLDKVFSNHGYQVLAASDGLQAIEIYRCYKARIDAVLLNIHLPKIAGEEVFRRMREENGAVKVVVASGYFEPETKSEMALAGVKRFVNKPYVLDDLLEVFQNVIDDQ